MEDERLFIPRLPFYPPALAPSCPQSVPLIPHLNLAKAVCHCLSHLAPLAGSICGVVGMCVMECVAAAWSQRARASAFVRDGNVGRRLCLPWEKRLNCFLWVRLLMGGCLSLCLSARDMRGKFSGDSLGGSPHLFHNSVTHTYSYVHHSD